MLLLSTPYGMNSCLTVVLQQVWLWIWSFRFSSQFLQWSAAWQNRRHCCQSGNSRWLSVLSWFSSRLTHLDEDFEKFKRGILKVKDYLFTFLSDPHVPYDNNASERGVRKIKVKQKVSGCFRTDSGADDFAKLHSIAETAMKNGNSKFNAILAVVQQ